MAPLLFFSFDISYPRRWRFPTDPQDEDSFSFVFQINKDPETDETFIEWLADEPNSKEELTFLRGHLYRLEKLKEYVYEEASKLTSKHERSVTLEFYEALVEALDHAVWSFDDGAGSPEQGGSHECVAGGLNENNSCDTEGSFAPDRVYDDLEAPITKLGFNTLIFDDYDHDHQSYEIVDYLESPYSIIEYQHSNKFNDTCLYLNEVLHTCTSFRPHYHEVFVHYPAQFVKEVKRVAFIGGGDGQILSEILKYPSLELVVGMELDHQIVRSSFENMKTQPHWDDDRVEWWYGDGAKSFFMLPKEYYGCFDLVLVDLLNEVVDRLKVAEHHSIMDAAMALVKPEGVVARNEDWYFGSNKPFAKYMIDLFYVEVPIIGHIGITVGSNYVDFFKQPPKDHKVHTLYLGPPDEKNKFAKWYNYKNNIEHTLGIDKQWSEEYTSDAGVLMIMEAERAGVAPNSLDLQSSVNEALKKAELNVIRVEMSPLTESDEFNTMIHILSEGYLVTRHYPQHTDYYGFELMLWDNFDKLNLTKRNLKAAVGSETFSCYRLVVDGIYTATTVKGMRQFGPSADVETGENDAGQVSDLQVSVEPSKMDEVLVESLTMASSKSKSVLVLCGQQTQACGTLDALQREKDLDLFPIFTCPDLSTYEQSSRNTISSQLAVSDCETATFAKLNEYATTVDKKVNVIAVDREVPHAMGKIFHAIFTAKKLRRKLLAKVHLLLATSAGKREGSWRSALLDRFRTDFALFDPAYRAEVTFRGSDGGMKLDLFSAGDVNFYERLKSTLATIEEKFDLFATLEDATNGVNNYGPDFEPSFFSTGNDYDQEPALKQRDTQEMIGKQMILQFVDRTTRRDGSLPVEQIRAAFTATLHEILSRSDKDSGLNVELFQQSEEIYVASAFWSSGSAILLWQHSADKTFATLNLFTRDESLDVGHLYVPFDNNFPSTLVADSYDEFPRGRGRIVSFPAKSII